MATRSRIGIVNEDGTVSSIYCHWDGYVEGVGAYLVNFYTDRDKVKALIDLGAISCLRQEVAPPPVFDTDDENVVNGEKILTKFGVMSRNHTFDKPMEGVTVAYHRDRGEDYISPRVDKSLDDYFQDDIEEYGYAFTLDGVWLYKSGYSEEGDEGYIPRPVNEALAKET